jgi:FkbM family methyltransferase
MKLRKFIKRLYKSILFKLSSADNCLYIGFYRYLYKPKRGSLAAFLHTYSKEFKPIRFLQIGANDGFNNDPLHKFIKRDGWEGVMLEPQPDVYRQFLTKIHRKRSGIIALNAALAKEDGQQEIYKIAFCNERWANGLSSFSQEVLLKKFEDGSIETRARKEGIPIPASKADWIVQETITTLNTYTVMKYFKDQVPDLLMVDTEGYDFEILKLIDLSKNRPDVIIFEEINLSAMDMQACRNYLKENSYSHISNGNDGLCIRNDRPDILAMAESSMKILSMN